MAGASTEGGSGSRASTPVTSEAIVQSDTSDAVARSEPKSTSENLRIIGGLLALISGLVALVVIVLVGMQDLAQEQAGAASAAGITAIATMVGAYFGVKVGSDGTKEAIKGQKEEAAKAQAFALAADPSKLDVIQKLLNGAPPPPPPPQPPAGGAPPQRDPGVQL